MVDCHARLKLLEQSSVRSAWSLVRIQLLPVPCAFVILLLGGFAQKGLSGPHLPRFGIREFSSPIRTCLKRLSEHFRAPLFYKFSFS